MLKNIGFGALKEEFKPIKKNEVAMERWKRRKQVKEE